MKNSKLSLEAFKAKAEKTNEKELLETVQGGGWSDCHGFLGGLGKYVRGEADSISWTIGGGGG